MKMYIIAHVMQFTSKTWLVYGQIISDRTHEIRSHWVKSSQVLSPSHPWSKEQTPQQHIKQPFICAH